MKKQISKQFDSKIPLEDIQPRLYSEFSSWWPLLSSPEEYAEEAKFYRKSIISACRYPPRTLLEIGSGGGNNASHLKAYFTMTLVDLSLGMLAVSKSLNPECEHIQGDMRNVRLERLFDAVFIHDAITHMTTEQDLRSVIETAFVHSKPGGGALFCPDHIRESFRPFTEQGGHDGGERSMRYLAWDWDPDPNDTTYITDFAYLLREGDKVRCEYDRFIMGLFGRDDWLRLITEVGFQASAIPFKHSTDEHWSGEVFLATKPVS
jgi:SAM-dependent methyltransferase